MLLLAILAFLQMTVLPGFLLLRYFKIQTQSNLQAVIYTFSLSLLSNYLIVFLLAALRIYTPLTIYIITAIELFLLAYSWRKGQKEQQGNWNIQLDFNRCVSAYKGFSQSNTFFYNFFLVISILFIGYLFSIMFGRFRLIFYQNDAVLSWNRWALGWYMNGIPPLTWRYPQLIPANWSLSYVITQARDLQFVPRNIMPLFSIGIMFLFLDLGLRKKKTVYFGALTLFAIIFFYLFRPDFITSGYIDIAVTFFGFLPFYVLLGSNESHSQKAKVFNRARCFLSVTFACAAAVTKQAGGYILFIILAWNLWEIYKSRTRAAKGEIKRNLLIIFLLVSVICLTWYVYKEIQIARGVDVTETVMVNSAHKNRTLIQRYQHGFHRLTNVGPPIRRTPKTATVFIFAILFFLLWSLKHPRARTVTLAVVIPYTLMWGALYSYDYRNLTIALPFAAFSAAIGFDSFVTFFRERWRKRGTLKIPVAGLLIVIIAAVAIYNVTLFNKAAFIQNQVEQQKKIGDHNLNKRLYQYYEKHGLDGKILSKKYPTLRHLPHLRDYWTADEKDKNLRYILENINRPNKQIVKAIKDKIRSGRYTVLFKHNQFRFLRINRPGELNKKGK